MGTQYIARLTCDGFPYIAQTFDMGGLYMFVAKTYLFHFEGEKAILSGHGLKAKLFNRGDMLVYLGISNFSNVDGDLYIASIHKFLIQNKYYFFYTSTKTVNLIKC